MNRQTYILSQVLIVLILLTLGFGACKEEFPPYNVPATVLSSELSIDSPDTVEVYYDATTALYYLNSIMVLKVSVTNVHDDLLQGKALVEGRITLQSFGQVPRAFAVPLSTGNLRFPPLFQGNIALGPQRKAEFSELWLPYATDGNIAFEGFPFAMLGGDKLYGPIEFIAFAEVQIFERVQEIKSSEIHFSLVFRVITQ